MLAWDLDSALDNNDRDVNSPAVYSASVVVANKTDTCQPNTLQKTQSFDCYILKLREINIFIQKFNFRKTKTNQTVARDPHFVD